MAEATFNSKDLEELAQNMYRTAEKLYPKEVKRFLQKGEQRGRYPTKKDPGCHQKEDGQSDPRH